MKKTLITLLALAGMACGVEESITLSTAPAYTDSQGGSYAGIVFTLNADDTERFNVTGGELTSTVTLSTITLTERDGYDLAAGRVLYVTNADNVYLGASSAFTKEDGTNVAVFDFANGITLNTSDTYYAYLTAPSDISTWVAGETTVGTGQYYSGQLAAAGSNKLTQGNAANWGLLNGQKALTSTSYAPVMSISVTPILVPEPATATLSLLALAGLAARRRRH